MNKLLTYGNQLLTHGYRGLDFFVEKPWRGLLLICGLQMVAWFILVTFFMPIPHYDILYHTYVGRDLGVNFWGEYYRHPPAAYLLTHLLNFGEPFLLYPHNIAAQLFVIATYGGVYHMGLALLNNKRDALVAVLLLIPLGVYHGLWDLQGLNHNVLQYPFWVLIPLATFHATRPLSEKARQSFWWLVLGVLLGIGLWTKISIGLLYGAILAWTLIDREARQHYKTPYPYLAFLVCLAIGAKPLYYGLLYWQNMAQYLVEKIHHEADSNSITHIWNILLYMAAVAVLAGGISLRTRLCYPFASMTRRASHFLLFITFMPFAVLAVGAVWRSPPLFSWTLPMYGLWGVVLVAIMRSTWRTYTPHLILLAAIVLLLEPVYHSSMKHTLYPRVDNHWVVAEKIMDEWNQQTDNAPLGIVYGTAGVLGGVVSLYNDADTPQERIVENEHHRGALVVFDSAQWYKDHFYQIIEDLQVPEQTMKIDEYPHVIHYAILPPAEK